MSVEPLVAPRLHRLGDLAIGPDDRRHPCEFFLHPVEILMDGALVAGDLLLEGDPAEIDRILGEGADRAAAIAEPILAETYEKVGFIRSRTG